MYKVHFRTISRIFLQPISICMVWKRIARCPPVNPSMLRTVCSHHTYENTWAMALEPDFPHLGFDRTCLVLLSMPILNKPCCKAALPPLQQICFTTALLSKSTNRRTTQSFQLVKLRTMVKNCWLCFALFFKLIVTICFPPPSWSCFICKILIQGTT